MLSKREINLDEVIRILAGHLDANRIIVTVLNRETSTIVIEEWIENLAQFKLPVNTKNRISLFNILAFLLTDFH